MPPAGGLVGPGAPRARMVSTTSDGVPAPTTTAEDTMDEAAHRAELERMRREIESLPGEEQPALWQLYEETVQRHERIQRSTEESRRALGQLAATLQGLDDNVMALDAAVQDLRLVAKMALFELEARQREQGRSDGEGTEGEGTP